MLQPASSTRERGLTNSEKLWGDPFPQFRFPRPIPCHIVDHFFLYPIERAAMHTTVITLPPATPAAITAQAVGPDSTRLFTIAHARRPLVPFPTSAAASETRAGRCALAVSRTSHGQTWEEAVWIVLAIGALGALVVDALQVLNAVAAW